jgi:hypothetical protein
MIDYSQEKKVSNLEAIEHRLFLKHHTDTWLRYFKIAQHAGPTCN